MAGGCVWTGSADLAADFGEGGGRVYCLLGLRNLIRSNGTVPTNWGAQHCGTQEQAKEFPSGKYVSKWPGWRATANQGPAARRAEVQGKFLHRGLSDDRSAKTKLFKGTQLPDRSVVTTRTPESTAPRRSNPQSHLSGTFQGVLKGRTNSIKNTVVVSCSTMAGEPLYVTTAICLQKDQNGSRLSTL